MVDALLAFKKKTDQLFHRPFKRDPSIGFAIRDAFESFINKRQNKPAEMLGSLSLLSLQETTVVDKAHQKPSTSTTR